MITISVLKDFSETPGARYPYEGDYSGEEFRTNILAPKLKQAIASNELLEINLDGTAGFGTSFLEEAFGGLIRNDKLNYDDIVSHLRFVSEEDPDYIEEIMCYIKDAFDNENK